MTAEAIEKDCNNDNPCLVWLAWSLRSNDLVLKIPELPALDIRVPVPSFTIPVTGIETSKLPSNYLRKDSWIKSLKRAVKGVTFVAIDDALMMHVDRLGSIL